jgi:ATP-dependent protease ClpP protease subunit
MKNIRIDGVIGKGQNEVSSQWFASQLPTDGSDIRVSIHSEGGSVFEGFAIHDELDKYAGRKVVAIESSAFSIASFIAMAADEIEMSPNAYFMLHNPRIETEGDDEELAKTAGVIASLKNNMVTAYATRMGKSTEEVQAILKAETYFDATEAVAIGLANRVTEKPIKSRAFAKTKDMPHRVVAALFGAGSGGDNDSPKGKPMSDSKPVAATVKEIKAAFPALAKKKPAFVIDCIERDLPLASVASAAAEEMMKENEELQAKLTAMEEEMTAMKAKAMEDEEAKAMEDEEEPDAKAEEDEDEKPDAKARRSGAAPIAKGTSGKPTASVRWDNAVEDAMKKTKNKMQAVALANRKNPGLRDAYLAEVNAR